MFLWFVCGFVIFVSYFLCVIWSEADAQSARSLNLDFQFTEFGLRKTAKSNIFESGFWGACFSPVAFHLNGDAQPRCLGISPSVQASRSMVFPFQFQSFQFSVLVPNVIWGGARC
jgi:hypothetical protein